MAATPHHPSDPPTFVVLPDGCEDGSADGWIDGPGAPAVGAGRRSTRAAPWLTGLAQRRLTRWATAALACAATGGLIVAALTTEHTAMAPVARPAVQVSPATNPATVELASGKPWPSAPGGCGTQRYLPIIAADPLRQRTGVRVQVGGQSVRTVDLDARSVSEPAGLKLAADRFVSQLVVSAGRSYALVQPCESTDTGAVIQLGLDGSALTLTSHRHFDGLFPDGQGEVWAALVEAVPTDGPVTMMRLPGQEFIRLPAGLRPVAVSGHRLFGVTGTAGQPQNPSSGVLVSYDLTSRRLGPPLGRASSLTVSAGLLLWTDSACSAVAPCALHRYDLSTGASSVRGYSLPVETSLTGGVLSPDRGKLAFALAREFQDPHADVNGFGPPYDLVVLDLRSGVLDRVTGLELPPTTAAGLSFSDRGDWLVIAVDGGSATGLLLWRSGLTRPLRAGVAVRGPMSLPPALAPLP